MEYRSQADRPVVMERDAYASGICPELLRGAKTIWPDIAAYTEELFAATATELGFPLWAEALGIKLTFAELSARGFAVTDYLQRGGTFSAARVREIAEKCLGSRVAEVEITEESNLVVITMPSGTSEAQFAAMYDAIEAERPLHVDVRLAGSMSL